MALAILINHNLLGDSLMTTPAVREFKRRLGPEYKVAMFAQDASFQRMLEGNPYIDILQFISDTDRMKLIEKLSPKPPDIKDCENILYDTTVSGKLWERPNGDLFCILDPGAAMGWCGRRTSVTKVENCYDEKGEKMENVFSIKKPHLSHGFADQLGVTLSDTHYDLVIDSSNIKAAKDYLSNHSKPVIVCAALSSSCTSRHHLYHPGEKPLGYANKMIDASVWNKVIEALKDKYDFVFLAAKNEPRIDVNDVEWLEGLDIKTVAALCKLAKCTISIDTGISHVCAAVDGPMVLMTAAVESGLTVPSSNGPLRVIDYSVQSGKPRRGIAFVTAEEIIENVSSIVNM